MNLSPLPIQKFFDNSGEPLVGGLLFTYGAGTSIKVATYTDSTGGTPNTNPVVLDFRGECRLWIDPRLTYKYVLAPKGDTDPPTKPIWSVDNITAGPAPMDNAAVDTGPVNNIQLSIPLITAPVAFTRIVFLASHTNTGPVTISINGGTAKRLLWQNTGELGGAEIQTFGIYEAIYDGGQWQLQGPTLNPPELRSDAEIAAGIIPVNYSYPVAHLFRYLTTAQKADFESGAMTLDLTVPLQNWMLISIGRTGFLPRGAAKYTTTLVATTGLTITGAGAFSQLAPWGCNGINVTGDFVSITNMQIKSLSAGGVTDPFAFIGVVGSGANGAPRNNVDTIGLYMRGWLRCIDWRYVITSVMEDCDLIISTVGVRLFGQTVNNSISNCRMGITGAGSCGIDLVADGGIRGEGLMISGTLIAGGVNAMRSDASGFLSIGIDDSCIIDLISGKAFDLISVQGFKCSAAWVYSDDTCFNFADLGASTQIDANINVGIMTCNGGATISAVRWGSNNIGLQLGGKIVSTNAASNYPVVLVGSGATVTSYMVKGNPALEAVITFTAGNTIETNGDRSVNWNVTPVATVASAAGSIALPRNGCKTFMITGAAAITTINVGSWDGQTVTLIAAAGATWTIADGSNMKLTANFTATADDTLTLTCSGANWYENARAAN